MDSKPQIKFSLLEKMEFYDDKQMKLLSKVFPKIEKKNVLAFIKLAVEDMSGDSESRDGSPTRESPKLATIAALPEALAIRRLVQILHREALHCDRDEVMEYLQSLHMTRECCEEVVSSLLSREIFNTIPKSVSLHPKLASLQWKIDISYCQRDPEKLSISTRAKVSAFHCRARVLLFLTFTDGRRASFAISPSALSRLRLAAQTVGVGASDVERRSQQPVKLMDEEREALQERGQTIVDAV